MPGRCYTNELHLVPHCLNFYFPPELFAISISTLIKFQSLSSIFLLFFCLFYICFIDTQSVLGLSLYSESLLESVCFQL